MKGLNHLTYKGRWESWDCSSREEKAWRGILSLYINTWREGVKRTEPSSCQNAQRQNNGQWAQTEIQEEPSEHQKTLFYCEGNQALAWGAQWDCGVPILGHSQKPSEHGHWLWVAVLVRGKLDQMIPRGTFKACSVILWCCIEYSLFIRKSQDRIFFW